VRKGQALSEHLELVPSMVDGRSLLVGQVIELPLGLRMKHYLHELPLL